MLKEATMDQQCPVCKAPCVICTPTTLGRAVGRETDDTWMWNDVFSRAGYDVESEAWNEAYDAARQAQKERKKRVALVAEAAKIAAESRFDET